MRRAEAQHRHIGVEGVRPLPHERGVVPGKRKGGPGRPGAQIRDPRARRLGRIGRVARTGRCEGAREVEEVPPRAGDSALLVRGVEAGRENVDQRSSARLGGGQVEGGDRGGIGEPLRGALLEDREAELEEDRLVQDARERGVSLGGHAEQLRDERRERPAGLDEKGRQLRGRERPPRAIALEAFGEVGILPAEALPKEGVEVCEAFREKQVRV